MRPPTHVIDNFDLVDFFAEEGGELKFVRKLAWGDRVRVLEVTASQVVIETVEFKEKSDGSQIPVTKKGFLKPRSGTKPKDLIRPIDQNDVFKVDFVDVQQGDAAVIESPGGKVVLIDGGDNQLFARYLAGRFRGTSVERPKEIDCVLITHGDADHFAGLAEIIRSEAYGAKMNPIPADALKKRLFILPRRVYHNGLVKRPGEIDGRKRKDEEMFGRTKKVGNDLVVTDLVDNLLDVPDEEMNKPFLDWKRALEKYQKRSGGQAIVFRRLKQGDHDAFDFLAAEGVETEVLGPLTTRAGGVEGLKFLGEPPKRPFIAGQPLEFKGRSASHTVNGHSVILRVKFGNFRFLFAGDLNHEAERDLVANHPASLEAEVFKVPHHGSADFSTDFIKAVRPVISVVSSGDESLRKEHIHPRANLMGALGRFSRVDEPLIFVTELAAFFGVEGWIGREHHVMMDGLTASKAKRGRVVDVRSRQRFFSFSRAAFGLVKVRTDGKRLLVWTNSGQDDKKEVYAFTSDRVGKVEQAAVRTA